MTLKVEKAKTKYLFIQNKNSKFSLMVLTIASICLPMCLYQQIFVCLACKEGLTHANMYVQVFVLQQFISLSWELMLAWEFIQQENRNGVTYERDDQILRHVEHNKHSEKLKTIVNLFRLGAAAYYWNRVVLSMPHGQGAHRHVMNNSQSTFDWGISFDEWFQMPSTLEHVRAYLYVFQKQLNLLDKPFSGETDHSVWDDTKRIWAVSSKFSCFFPSNLL